MRSRLQAERNAERVGVWPCNWHALMVCADMHMRTLCAGTAVITLGFDFGHLALVLSAHKHTPHRRPWPVLWRQIKAFEAAAVEAINEG